MKNKIIFKDINKDLSSVKSKLFVCGFFQNDTLDKSLDKLLNWALSKTIKLESGGYISVKTGGAPDGNAMPIFKENADEAFDSATCIGCGACVAACKNSSAMMFVGAKINQYAQLPQGQVEHSKRVYDMVTTMDKEGFGSCTNTGACEAECPKEISIDNIVKLNREYLKYSKNW